MPKPLCQLAFRAKNTQPIKVEGIVLPTLEEIAEYAGVTEPPILNEFMEPTAADLFARIKDILNNRYQDGFDCRAMVNSNIATPEEIKAIQRLEGPEVSTGLYL